MRSTALLDYLVFASFITGSSINKNGKYFKFRKAQQRQTTSQSSQDGQSSAASQSSSGGLTLKFRVLPFNGISLHFSKHSGYLETTPGEKSQHSGNPVLKISSSKISFGEISNLGSFREMSTESFDTSLETKVGQDFVVMSGSPDEVVVARVWGEEGRRITELGRFKYTKMTDFNFVGFRSGQLETQWLVEQS